jgi:DNA-binding MarR family transcriptional regulator
LLRLTWRKLRPCPKNFATSDKHMKNELILEDFLPYRLSITSHTVSTNIARVYEKRFGVSVPEWRVIAILGRYPGLSAVEVADRTLMDKVAVSRAVTKLIKTGRIDREFADADRRRSILNLSEEGRQVHNEIAPLALRFEQELLQNISEKDYETFNTILEQLLDKARQLGG